MNAFRIKAIDNPNEIILHHLEVIRDIMYLEKRKYATLELKDLPKYTIKKEETINSISLEFEQMVLNAISSSEKEYGVSEEELFVQFSSENPEKIKHILVTLRNNGQIIQSINEQTYIIPEEKIIKNET